MHQFTPGAVVVRMLDPVDDGSRMSILRRPRLFLHGAPLVPLAFAISASANSRRFSSTERLRKKDCQHWVRWVSFRAISSEVLSSTYAKPFWIRLTPRIFIAYRNSRMHTIPLAQSKPSHRTSLLDAVSHIPYPSVTGLVSSSGGYLSTAFCCQP